MTIITGARGRIVKGETVIGYVGNVTKSSTGFSLQYIKLNANYKTDDIPLSKIEVFDKDRTVIYTFELPEQILANINNGFLSVEKVVGESQ